LKYLDKPQFPAGVRTNHKKEKWREVSLGGKGELGRQFSEEWTYGSGGGSGGGGGSARTWGRAKPGARAGGGDGGGDVGRAGDGVPGARATGGGSGSRVGCWGGRVREHSGGGGQRAYLRGPGEAGDMGW
jgi:hypothetical protein